MTKVLVSIFCFVLTFNAAFANQIKLVRDAEVESFLEEICRPIFVAANLNHKNITFYIVNDNSINAFVAAGMNIFVNTGLFRQSKNPDMVLGVLAHETGHIAGGHLARGEEAIKDSLVKAAAGYLAGIAAAAAGRADAAMAIFMGSNQIAERSYLRFSREQEQAADLAGMSYLEKNKLSAAGLYSLMQLLDMQFKKMYDESQISPYMLTHPLSRERLLFLGDGIRRSQYSHNKMSQKYQDWFAKIVAKLDGFMEDPERLKKDYFGKTDPLSKYRLAIVKYRIGDFVSAVSDMEKLESSNVFKNDPYFLETLGQIAFEGGFVEKSLSAYRKSDMLLGGKSELIRLTLYNILIHGKAISSAENKDIINSLNIMLNKGGKNDIIIYRMLATIYEKQKNMGMSYLYLAEEALALEKYPQALRYANLSEKEPGFEGPRKLRALDIKTIAESKLAKK